MSATVDLRPIPSRYKPVAYIQTDNQSTYSSTNIYIRGNPVVFRVKYKFQFTNTSTSDMSFWGACNNGTGGQQGIKGPNFYNGNVEFTGLIKTNYAFTWAKDSNIHTVEMQVKSGDSWIKFDGTTKFTETTTGVMNSNMQIGIFSAKPAGIMWGAQGRLYSMEFFQDEKPIANLIPVYDTTSSKAGFYDVVNNTFIGATAGTYSYGSDTTAVDHFVIGGSNVYAIKKGSTYIFKNLFTPCSYIANSGTTEYIDTGILETATNNWDGHFYLPSFASNYFNGSKQNGSGMGFNAFYYKQIVEYNYLNVNFTNTANDITITESLSGSTMSVKLNGTTATATKGTPVSETTSILLFGIRRKDGTFRHYNVANCKLYYWKIRQGTTLVRDFIPVKTRAVIPADLVNTGVQVAANVYGLFDKVSGKFFTNSGSGSFTGA